MGLDISAYKHAQFITSEENEDEDEGTASLYVNPHYTERADGLATGLYTVTDKIGFRAGSYGGYNGWRDNLAKLAGYPLAKYEVPFGGQSECHAAGAWEAEGGAFWELINFSDCEGIIGPKTSAKLAADFATFQPMCDEMDERFRTNYAAFRGAFELAANGGVVSFH